MNKSTALSELGIYNLDKIKRIEVEQTDTADILTIYYRKPLLDFSRRKKKITFNRPSRQILGTNILGKNEWSSFSCPSPKFQLALDELHAANRL